jgi:hypothetical protein
MNQGKTTVFGGLSTNGTGPASNAAAYEFCVPGSSDTCSPPVGYWKFDENTGSTTKDSSGNGRNGTLINTPSWEPGKVGHALKFTDVASDPEVELADDTLDALTSGTIEFWFKPTDSGDNAQDIMGLTEPAGIRWWEIIFDRTNDRLSVYAAGTGSNCQLRGYIPFTDRQTAWHHFSFTNGSSGNIFYLDGVKTTATYITGTSSTDCFFADWTGGTTTEYTLGCWESGASCDDTEMYQGLLDEVKIYDYVRTPAQIAWSYNQGAPMAWYKLDETSGTTAYNSAQKSDSTAYGVNGTLTPGATGNTAADMIANGATGKFNRSLDFDGTNDYVSVAFSQSLDFTENLTVSFWFKPTVTINSGIATNKGLISKANTSTDANNDWVFFWSSGDSGRMRFGTYGDNIATTTATWTAGTWYFITATVSSTNTAEIYVNGKLDTYQSDNNIITSPINGNQDTALNIGLSKVASGDLYFDGQIDDVRIYNYTLTSKQIKDVMNTGTIRFGPVTGSP